MVHTLIDHRNDAKTFKNLQWNHSLSDRGFTWVPTMENFFRFVLREGRKELTFLRKWKRTQANVFGAQEQGFSLVRVGWCQTFYARGPEFDSHLWLPILVWLLSFPCRNWNTRKTKRSTGWEREVRGGGGRMSATSASGFYSDDDYSEQLTLILDPLR